MRQISVIAEQTFREAVRNKVLFIFIILSLITICCSVLIPVVGDGREKIKIVESMCFRSIAFSGTLVAILMSASSIPSDIDDKILCTVTTKPIGREKIVSGKIVGFLCIMCLLLLIMGSVSYSLIRITAVKHGDEAGKALLTREKILPYTFRITGKPARNIGNFNWIEGGGTGASVWKFKGLNIKEKESDLEIRADFLIESKNAPDRKIPVNITVIGQYSGDILSETINVSRNKPLLLRRDGQILDRNEEFTIRVCPENSGDFISVDTDSIEVFSGEKSFGYNYLKGMAMLASQFLLMVIIAVTGSTFLSLPVNILFCLFVFFCGNISEFMRDFSTVVNIFQTSESEHGVSTLTQRSNILFLYLNNVVKKPIMLLSYILPDFRFFSVGHYLTDGINIPYQKVFRGFGYATLYGFFCLPVSFVVFRRREFI